MCQAHKAIEPQLDKTASRPVLASRLKQVAAKINYWQRRARQAAAAHCRRRRKELRRAGVDLRRAIRCPRWFEIAVRS
jgi:hypothetical protein